MTIRNRTINGITKLTPRRNTGMKPCRERECDITTNKRYQAPQGRSIAACCFDHALAAYQRRACGPQD